MTSTHMAELGIHVRRLSGTQRATCPRCSPERRKSKIKCLAVTFQPDGAVWICHHCGWKGGMRARDDWSPAPRRPQVTRKAEGEGATAWTRRLWDSCADPRGTPAEAYLRKRGLGLPPDPARVIRYHPRLKTKDDPDPPGPTLVAAFTDLRTDVFTGITRIFLTADGQKRFGPDDPHPVKAFAGNVGGAAIKLDPDDAVTLGLVVCEGAESALAARMLGYRPCWALGSAGAIGGLPVLGGIDGLTIVADTDSDGMKAARACADRWSAAGVDVEIIWWEPAHGL
jgi:Toprim domain